MHTYLYMYLHRHHNATPFVRRYYEIQFRGWDREGWSTQW